MAKVFIILSHNLTDDQEHSLKSDMNIADTVYMPDNLKKLWSNINPYLESISDILEPMKLWLSSNGAKGDYAVIQGDMGASFIMINYAFSLGMIPCYTTTERIVIKETEKDGSVNLIKKFKHIIFRRYEK